MSSASLSSTIDHFSLLRLCSAGIVLLRINKWVDVSFCLPHKVHNVGLAQKGIIIEVREFSCSYFLMCIKERQVYSQTKITWDSVETGQEVKIVEIE
jgi:hypothetical protein